MGILWASGECELSQQTYLLPAGWRASSFPVEGWQNSAVAVGILAEGCRTGGAAVVRTVRGAGENRRTARLGSVKCTLLAIGCIMEAVGLTHYPVFLMNQLPNLLTRITKTPGQCGGRPCLEGMRIRVSDILEMLAENGPRNIGGFC